MSGERLLLDTNAIAALLQGEPRMEFLAFTGLQDEDRQLFNDFLARVEVIGLRTEQVQLIKKAISFRKHYRLKLPDAIIAATAHTSSAKLVTADGEFRVIKEIEAISL